MLATTASYLFFLLPFSLHSHSQRPSLIPSKPFPLPLNRREHQSAKNTEIANRNFSPEMTNLLQFVFPNRSCGSRAQTGSTPPPSPHLHKTPFFPPPLQRGGTPHLHSVDRGQNKGRGQRRDPGSQSLEVHSAPPLPTRGSTQRWVLRPAEGYRLCFQWTITTGTEPTVHGKLGHFIYKISSAPASPNSERG